MEFLDVLMNLMIFSLIWRLIWSLPGGIWTVLAIVALVYFWRRGSFRNFRFGFGGGRRAFDPSRDRRSPAAIAGLTVAYGDGGYLQDGDKYTGRILMSADKLYLVGKDGKEIGPSFVPVGKIVKLSRSGGRLDLEVVLSLTEAYEAAYFGERAKIADLADEIVSRRGLKKGWFSGAYTDPDH
jgi:hypothetical protein